MSISTSNKINAPEYNTLYFRTSKHISQQRFPKSELRQNAGIEGLDGHKVSYNIKQLKSLYHPLFHKEQSRENLLNKFNVIKEEKANKTHYAQERLMTLHGSIKSNDTSSTDLIDQQTLSQKTPTCLKRAIKTKRKHFIKSSPKKKNKKVFLHLNEDLNCDLSKEVS